MKKIGLYVVISQVRTAVGAQSCVAHRRWNMPGFHTFTVTGSITIWIVSCFQVSQHVQQHP